MVGSKTKVRIEGPEHTMPDDLYPYQVEDSEKMASNGNWLNFNEMGTGKTPETMWTAEMSQFQCILVVCPNSLRLEWGRQVSDWIGEDKVAVCTTDSYTKLDPIMKSFLGKGTQKYKVLNYEALRNDLNLEILSHITFDLIVFDEIHKTRNPDTKMARGLWKFLDGQKKAKIIGLSGSPIMNYPNDLYVPLSIVYPDLYPRTKREWTRFVRKWCNTAVGKFGTYVYGARSLEDLKAETKGFCIRRTKAEVLPFLPEKYYRKVVLEMPPDQRALYNQMEQELKILLDTGEPLWSTNVLSTITRLRQLNLDPHILGKASKSAKTDFLVELNEDTDGKLVIFSCFEVYIDFLSHTLFRDVPHVVVTGKTPSDQRSRRVKQFQEDPNIKLFLGTIQTAGEGITLTASSNVILADRWWNEPTNQQAIDRLHRIGQENKVQVILPVCKDSIDSSLDAILARKDKYSEAYFPENKVRDLVMEDRTGR